MKLGATSNNDTAGIDLNTQFPFSSGPQTGSDDTIR